MTVYVITKGCYSDYHICGVALDEAEAERLCERYTDKWDDAHIEEYNTEDNVEALKYKEIYRCWFYKEHKSLEVCTSECDTSELNKVEDCGAALRMCVAADDKSGALKKASDIFAKYRAEKEGL